MNTPLCTLLRIEAPILCAPMGPDITGLELAAAVSNAGGLGVISFGGLPPEELRRQIRELRSMTRRPFGVNFILQFPCEPHVDVCVEERVPLLSTFWGDPAPVIDKAHGAGLLVIHQAGSVEESLHAVHAGADVVIAQGGEAGGHLAGDVSTFTLLPAVVDAVAPVPVVAAGGIVDGRGLAAALALGAAGVSMGTRFLASPESRAHARYKERVLEARETDTVRTTLFGGGWPNAPHRTLRTAFVEEWLAQEARGSEQRPDEPVIGERSFSGERIPVTRFWAMPPDDGATGDIDSMALLAGQSAGRVHSLAPAATIVDECVREARRTLEGLSGLVATA